MTDSDQRAFAETVFERNQRREAEINEALKQENARREAAGINPRQRGGSAPLFPSLGAIIGP